MNRPLFKSLRGRLLVVLLTLTALPALLIGVLAYHNARQTVESQVIAQLTSVADLKKEQITTWLDDRTADARLLADNFLNEEHFTEILDPHTDPERRAAFAAFLTDNLRGVQQARAGYSEIMMVDATGRVILSTDPARVGMNLTAYPAIAMTFASPTGEFTEDIHREGETGEIEMAFSHMLHSVDLSTETVLADVNGVVIIRVRMEETIYPLIRNWPGMGKTGETLLVRRNGNTTLFLNPLLFDEGAALTLRVPVDSPNAKPAHLSAAGQEGIVETPDYRGVPVLAAYRAIPQTGWGFVAKQDMTEAFASVTELTRQWILVTALILLAASGTAVLLARAITQPITQLATATQSVAEGNYETELAVQRADEIGALADSFRAMLRAVRQSHAEMSALSDLSRTLLGTLDVATTLNSALHQAISATRSDAGAIALSSDNGEAFTFRASFGFPALLLGQRYPMDAHTAVGFALIHRQPIVSADLERETRFRVSPLIHEAGAQANLAVPMLIGERAIGALVVDAFTPRVYTAGDIQVAQAIANQTAIALERVRLFNNLSDSYDRTLDALVAALDARDKETEGHSRRVVAYTLALARQMNVPEEELITIRRGALLHDIGKIGVPDAILRKPGPLTDEEWSLMRSHPEWGKQILSRIPFLREAANIVYAHHERWDGQGYPSRLAGDAIPLGARLFAVADTYDAITSDRPYRAARSYTVALAEIESGSGTQFDSHVVAAFQQIPEPEWKRLRAEVQKLPRATGPLSLRAEPLTVTLQLEALSRLTTAVSGSLDLAEILREAALVTVDTLGAAACGLFLYDSTSDTLSLAAEHGLPDLLKTRFAHFSVKGFHNEVVVREACRRLCTDLAEVPAFVEMGLPQSRPDLGAYLCVPLTAKGEVMGMMGLFSRRPRTFDEREQALHQNIGEQIGLAIANARLHESVRQLAITDSLTGAYNRRYLDVFLGQELGRCARYGHSLSLILLDIDRFKDYNDAYGHLAGDEALRQVVGLLRHNVREADLVARYGGEEFAVVLPETEATGAYTTAEKMRGMIEAHPFPHGRLTISLGVAHYVAAQKISPNLLMTQADQALYGAKRNGRNNVCLWKPGLASLMGDSNSSD